MHLDVASGGELHVALAAGVPAARLVLHGNNKSTSELAAALDAGSAASWSTPSTRSPASGACWNRFRPRRRGPRVLVRVTPGVEAHTHEFVRTGQEDSKFGFSVSSGAAAEAVAALELLPGVELVGVHAHIGSQVFDASSFEQAAEVLGAFFAPLGLPELVVGGGLGVPYVNGESGADPGPSGPRPPGRPAPHAGVDPATRITAEPGRSIVATAGHHPLHGRHRQAPPGIRTYVSVDGGMSDNPRPVLYGSGYEAFLPRSAAAPASGRRASWASTARAGTSWCPRRTCPTTWRSATSWPRRSRAPTATHGLQLQQGAPAGGRLRRGRDRPGRRPSGDLRGPHPPRRLSASRRVRRGGTAGGVAVSLYRLEVTAAADRADAQDHPHAHPAPTVRVALLGCGNVGGALAESPDPRRGRRRPHGHPPRAGGDRRGQSGQAPRTGHRPDLIGTDAAALVARGDVDVVVELIGGLHPARELIETALRNGKPVVTGNKALLATAGAELAEVAAAAGVDLLYEAAVAGAIPVIRPLRESLAGEQILPRHGHRQRDHQLHPHPDGGGRRRLRRRAARGPGARLRRARPDGRRGGPRRRGQGGDPGRSGLRGRRRRRRRAPGGHQRGERGRRRLRQPARATRSSCSPSPSWSTAVPRSRCGCTRPWSPRRTRWPRCAARSTPSSSRAP